MRQAQHYSQTRTVQCIYISVQCTYIECQPLKTNLMQYKFVSNNFMLFKPYTDNKNLN